jgi:demethylmenaquinone methyltransferase/2-methoxy-6-polyprenyl-1,4-benzoquinol methylase
VPTEGSIQASNVQRYFARIAQRYDLANHLLSLGLDILWRKRAAQIVAARHPSRILDLATGSGDLALALQRACPSASIVGADFCEPMLRVAQSKGLSQLLVADALQLPFANASFDAVTVAFGLRNMASWNQALAEIQRTLRPGGSLLLLDFGLPPQPWRTPYRLYLHHVLPKLAAWLTAERDAYDYLGQSIESFPSGPQMTQRLETQGFTNAKSLPLLGGIAFIYTALKA